MPADGQETEDMTVTKTKKKTRKKTTGTRTGRMSARKPNLANGPKPAQLPEPMPGKVLVKRREAPDMTAGGVALPAQYCDAMNPDRKTIECEVLAVGPARHSKNGNMRIEPQVQVGDLAIVDIFGVTDLLFDTQNLFVVNEDEGILAVVR